MCENSILRSHFLKLSSMRLELLELFRIRAFELSCMFGFYTSATGRSLRVGELQCTTPPLPTITGLEQPTVVNNTSRRPLEWWQILLMALGCAFILLMFIWCFRRRARKQRAHRTAYKFAQTGIIAQPTQSRSCWWYLKRAITFGIPLTASGRRNVLRRNQPPPSSPSSPSPASGGGGWKWRLVQWGEKFFGHRPSTRVVPAPTRRYEISEPFNMTYDNTPESVRLERLRAAEEARRGEADYDQLLGQYDYPREEDRKRNRDSRASAPSLYSQMTGVPRKGPDPRIPIKS
ncbi:hypothetical protein ONZ45_g6360 [Pleurotus djamor]|nr:hypothetical protein ONZ45_g6360 [Pleurotus djamor]